MKDIGDILGKQGAKMFAQIGNLNTIISKLPEKEKKNLGLIMNEIVESTKKGDVKALISIRERVLKIANNGDKKSK